MPKGQPTHRYIPEPTQPVSTGQPQIDSVVAYVLRELQRVSAAFEFVSIVDFLHVEPDKPREGMIIGADGTDWNPGGGKGVYAYYNSTWNKLG